MQRGRKMGLVGIIGSTPLLDLKLRVQIFQCPFPASVFPFPSSRQGLVLGEGVVGSRRGVLSSESLEVPRNSRFYLLMNTARSRGTQRETGKTCLPSSWGGVCVYVCVCEREREREGEEMISEEPLDSISSPIRQKAINKG